MGIPRTGSGPDYEVNRNFLIRFYEADNAKPRLITAKQLREMLADKKVAEHAINKILHTPKDRILMKFRRGIRIIAIAR